MTSYDDCPTTPPTIAAAATTPNADPSLPRMVCGKMAILGLFAPTAGPPLSEVTESPFLGLAITF
jgi:hypothetical protein